MKIEVTEKEAQNVFWNRIATQKRLFLALALMLIPGLVFVITTAIVLPDLSDWISVPIAACLIMPGFATYMRLMYRAKKVAAEQLAELKEQEL